MQLSDLNTTSFIFDPKSSDFLDRLEKYEEFQFDIDKLDKQKLCVYIALMCDPQSDIRKSFSHYPSRKREAALCAGFNLKKDNKFPEHLEDVLVGQNRDFNRACIKYLSFAYNPNFTRLNIYQQLQNAALLNAILATDSKSLDLAEKLTERLKKEEEFIFGGDEVLKMRESLYEEAALRELDFKPEDIAHRLSEGEDLSEYNRYGKDYKVDDLKFKGDVPPKEK
jgi:hypothetical protein